MKRLLLFFFICIVGIHIIHARDCCPDPQVIDRLQQLQRDIDTIKSKVCNNQMNIVEVESSIEDLSVQISITDVTLCSKIENLDLSTVEAVCSGIEDIEEQLSLVEVNLCSKIENIESVCSGIEELEEQLSLVEVNLCSKIENIESVCSGIDELSEQLSISDIMLCSKIGTIDDPGTCLDSQIDVPQDIDNLDLTTIALLKTILLELRGCNAC